MIFDTHAHYDDDAFDADREALLASLPEHGIAGAANMGASPEGARESRKLAHAYAHVWFGAGIHPDHAGCMNEAVMEELREMCRDEKCVAVGEIGLDYHWMVEPKEVQKTWFIRQLHLAAEENLPVNVHSREAAADTFDIIRREHAGTTGGIIHSFSGSAQMAMDYVRLGYHLGIGGVITFKNARVLREVVEAVPLSHLVTETDSPYLTPEPYRGKRNSSLNIPYIIRAIAKIKGLEEEETERILYENALRVYGKTGKSAEDH